MIDKVRLDLNYQKYKVNPQTRKIPTGELYARDPGEQGVVYEPSDKKTEKDSVTLSSVYEVPEEKEKEKEVQDTFGAKAGGIFKKAISAIRAFFSRLWNGPEAGSAVKEEAADPAKTETAAEIVSGIETVSPTKSVSSDFLQEIIKSKDREKLMQYVTENGKKRLAKNSDLLTSYDRSGHIVDVSPSDRRLILEGNFRDIRL